MNPINKTPASIIRSMAVAIDTGQWNWPHEYLHGMSLIQLADKIIEPQLSADLTPANARLLDKVEDELRKGLGNPSTWGMDLNNTQAARALFNLAGHLDPHWVALDASKTQASALETAVAR